MSRNLFPVSFFVVMLAVSLTLSSNFSFAEEEHHPETHEEETEEIVAAPAEEEHLQAGEHSSHEREGTEHEIKEEPEHGHILETTGPHVHSSATAVAAQWVGVGTLLAAAPVFGIKARSANKLTYKNVVLILALGAGIMHILLTPDHLVDVAIEHAILFAAAGSAWIGFGLLFMARPRRRLAIIGTAGTIGMIILYFVTRIEGLPEPFGAPEGIDPVGITAKIIEISLVALLIYLAAYLRKAETIEIGSASRSV